MSIEYKIQVPKHIKEKLYHKANFSCEICGRKKDLQIHHIIPIQQGINHNLNNLKLLCKGCHDKQGKSSRDNKRKIIELSLTFEDREFKAMKKLKGKLSWHNFIVLLVTHAKESIKRGDLEIFKTKQKQEK